jgi:protein tyrosine/serine phosphatase
MIKRFRKVTDGLYRGSAPTPQDVLWLKKNLGIKKIVSLDKKTGEKIDRTCQMLGIDHVKEYIDGTRKSLYDILSKNLNHLLIDGGPTFFHCHCGKDRTGLVAALFKVKYMGVKPQDAIDEAKSLGFGVGADPRWIHIFERLIRSAKPVKDTNHADIVSNEREYISDNRDSYLDEAHRGDSWSTYLDHTRQNPMDAVYVYNNDQSPTRENYQQTWKDPKDRMDRRNIIKKLLKELVEDDGGTLDEDAIKSYMEEESIPQVGVYNNDAGQKGFGPTENYSGFFYD